MEYEQIVEESIHYIKEHINENLSAQKIADYVGYSVFHFCRIFSLIKNISVMEYVRKYRLSIARSELKSNKKIIDIAMEYGFETASGFTKSFHKEFGYTPTSYLVRMKHSDCHFIKNISEVMEEPTLVTIQAFKIAGYGIYIDLSEKKLEDISAHWASYEGENMEEKMYTQLQPSMHGEIGICLPTSQDEQAVYLFGVRVDDFEKVTSDMMVAEIAGGEYAVFTTPPVNNLESGPTYEKDPLAISVKETWRYIFKEWFSNHSYVFDDTRYAFEFYDEHCHPCEHAIMFIYVPIKKKGNEYEE